MPTVHFLRASPEALPVKTDPLTQPEPMAPAADAGLRLVGTAALNSLPSDHAGILLLRQACAAQAALVADAMRLQLRLKQDGRCDPIQAITGTSSLEKAAAELADLVRVLDERLSTEASR
jgi:hypothetical protein